MRALHREMEFGPWEQRTWYFCSRRYAEKWPRLHNLARGAVKPARWGKDRWERLVSGALSARSFLIASLSLLLARSRLYSQGRIDPFPLLIDFSLSSSPPAVIYCVRRYEERRGKKTSHHQQQQQQGSTEETESYLFRIGATCRGEASRTKISYLIYFFQNLISGCPFCRAC